MSYPLLPTLLGASFLLVWAFIGGMIFRDEQREVRRQRDLQPHYPLGQHRRRSRRMSDAPNA